MSRSRGDRRPRALRRGRARVPRARARARARRRVRDACKDDLEGARELLAEEDGEDEELREVVDEAPARLARARGRDPPGDGRARPQRRQERDRRDPGRDRRRRGGAVRRRPLQDADPLRRGARLHDRGALASRRRRSAASRRSTFAIKGDGAYSVFKFEGGTHRVQRVPKTESQGRIHTSTATVAVLPEAEEVEVEVAPERSADRRLPLLGPGRPVGQHDRLGGADHPQADRDRGLDAGREVAASEPRQGDAGAARPALRARRSPNSGGRSPPSASRRSGPASARRRSAPTTSPRAGSPTTGSS